MALQGLQVSWRPPLFLARHVHEIDAWLISTCVSGESILAKLPRWSGGNVTLPHGTGKQVRVLVLCTPEKEAEAQAAGAGLRRLGQYVDKIKSGWTDVDVIICTPNVMGKVGALGRILVLSGLMPNPKTGTVTMEVG